MKMIEKLTKRECKEVLERRNGIGEEVDPRDFSGSGFFRVIVRKSVRNGACSVI